MGCIAAGFYTGEEWVGYGEKQANSPARRPIVDKLNDPPDW